jgi:hypothetical protein
MNRRLASILFLYCILVVTYNSAVAQSRDERIIAYAKRIRVSSLDPTLPKQPIEIWLKSIVGSKAVLSWEVNDCGEQTGVAGDGSSVNPPLCAEVDAKLTDGRKVGILIAVGTHKSGLKGKPNLFYIYVNGFWCK